FTRGQELAEPPRIYAGDALVKLPRGEVAAELARFLLRDQMPESAAADAEQPIPVRKQVLDDLRQREGGVLEAEPDEVGVLVEQGDHFPRFPGEPALRRGEQIEVGQHDDSLLDGPADRVAELADHRAHEACRNGALRGVLYLPAVQ